MYPMSRQKIPKAIRQQVWIQHFGKVFSHKCYISWCDNVIDVFNFHCGHNTPHSKGGSMELDNLFPICANCNLGMGDKFTIKEWCNSTKPRKKWCYLCVFC